MNPKLRKLLDEKKEKSEALESEIIKGVKVLRGLPGKPGKAGKPGKNGKSPSIPAIINEVLSQIPIPADGKPGDPGEPGKDSTVPGPRGPMPKHRWRKTSLQFEQEDGSWGTLVELKGDKGDKGDVPEHQISGLKIRFRKPDGKWGEYLDLEPVINIALGALKRQSQANYGGPVSFLMLSDTPDSYDGFNNYFLKVQNGQIVFAAGGGGGASAWGGITGTLSDQTDLQTALDLKADDNTVVHTTGNESIAGIKTILNNVWYFDNNFSLTGKPLSVDGAGRQIVIEAGTAKGENSGGIAQLKGGDGDATAVASPGAAVNILGGVGYGTGDGGDANVYAGGANGDGNGGRFYGKGGGNTTGGVPGEAVLEGGTGGMTDQGGADVFLKGGTPNGAGNYGKIKIQTQGTYYTRLDNSLATTNHEISFPDADGVILLDSDLSAYALDANTVHLTGDEHISGKKSFNSGIYDHIGGNVRSIDTSGRQLINQDGEIILDWSANAIEFHDPLSGQQLTFDTTLLGANRTITFQDGDGTVAFLSDITGGSGITRTVINTSGAATLPATASVDFTVYVTGAHDQTMPTAVGNTNQYTIKNLHSASITIDTTGVETIEGDPSITLTPGASENIQSDGNNWYVVA